MTNVVKTEDFVLENKIYNISLLHTSPYFPISEKDSWWVRVSLKNMHITHGRFFNNESSALEYYNKRREKLIQKETVL